MNLRLFSKPALMEISEIPSHSCVYISGKMSGLADLGKSKMDYMEHMIRGKHVHFNIMNPYYMVDQSKSLTWGECMVIDIRDIMTHNVKAVYLCDNWSQSKGAVLEVLLFLAIGVPIFDEFDVNITNEVFRKLTPEFVYSMIEEMVMTHSVE